MHIWKSGNAAFNYRSVFQMKMEKSSKAKWWFSSASHYSVRERQFAAFNSLIQGFLDLLLDHPIVLSPHLRTRKKENWFLRVHKVLSSEKTGYIAENADNISDREMIVKIRRRFRVLCQNCTYFTIDMNYLPKINI